MDIKHLRYYLVICECQSLTKASHKLNIAQPSLSLILAQLEREYNCRLFDRLARKMVLTEEGKKLYQAAKLLIADFDQIPNLVNPNGTSFKLRIASSITYSTFSLLEKVKAIEKVFPEIELELIVDSSLVIEKLVKNLEVDLGIIEGESHFTNLELKAIKKDHLVFVVAKDSNILIKNKTELANQAFLLRNKGSAHREIFDNWISTLKIPYKIKMESIDTNVLIKACKAGLGIAFLPYEFVKDYLDDSLRIINIEEDNEFSRQYSLVYYKQKYFNEKSLDIVKILLE